MINKIILFLLVFISHINAYDSLDISKIQNKSHALSYMYCIEDKENNLAFDDILKSTDLTLMKKSNLGYNFNNYWCKLTVVNNSNENKDFVFYNPRPGVDFIDVNIYQNNSIKTLKIGDMNLLENRDFDSIFSNFHLKLKANENVTIITKYQTIGNVEIDWEIKDIKDFSTYNNLSFTLMSLYIGFMFAIMLYKFFTYIYIKDKIYLIYSVFVLSAILSNISVTGFMHYYLDKYIDLYTITVFNPIFSHVFLTFLWLFTFYFFQISKKSRFYYPFLFIIFYNIVITILYLYSYIDINIIKITPIILLLALIESILLFIFSFIMLIKKKAGSLLFFIGHIAYISSIVLYILNLSGNEVNIMFTLFISSFGIFLATCFMSLSLSSRFKILKEENNDIKKEIEKNKQYTLIGTTISYITHQWRQPLSILSSQIMRIQAMIDNRPQVKIVEIKKDIDDIQNNIIFLNSTLSSIKALFQISTVENDDFNLSETLDIIKNSLSCILKQNNIQLILNVEFDKKIFGNQNLFIHAIKNILQNSIDSISDKDIKNGFIKIKVRKEINSTLVLLISDNAGGINPLMLNSIFEHKTTKKVYGMGIGLTIVKEIIEKEFKGKINVQNEKKGTKFIIEIPL